MKLNSTVALTFVLLALMFGAGLVSAAWGLVVGREALKGITQPDTRPANNLAQRKGKTLQREEVVLLKEEEVIQSVRTRMSGGGSKPAPVASPKSASPKPVEPPANKKPDAAGPATAPTEAEATGSVAPEASPAVQ